MVKARAQAQETEGAVDQARQSVVETIRRVIESFRSLLSTLAGNAKAVMGRIRVGSKAGPRASGGPDPNRENIAQVLSTPQSALDLARLAKLSVDEKPGQITPLLAQVVELTSRTVAGSASTHPQTATSRTPPVIPAGPEKAEGPSQAAPTPELEIDTIFEGDVELAIAVPVDLAALAKLYNYLQSTPDIKILYTRGSLDRGTTITVSLDKPAPFIGMLSRVSGLKIARATPQKDRPAAASGSLLGAKRPEAKRVDLALRME